MKLTAEQKTKLGIEFDGDEVPETEIFKAGESLAEKLAAATGTAELAALTARAEAGDKLVEQKRTEVTRLAKLAELGADAGDLDEVVSQQIEKADADTLVKLEGYFQKKVADKFPNGRTSQEESDEIESAGGVKQEAKQLPKVSVL